MDSSDSQTDDLFMPEFLNETFCNVNDEGLVQATVEVLKTGRLTPLIKEELKCTIQTRRLSEGKDELQVEFNSPEKTSLRPEEVERQHRRREQNRRAAMKFRQKKKDRTEILLRETQKLQNANTTLRDEIDRLVRERNHLTEVLSAHQPRCSLGLATVIFHEPP
ncbi:cyclic AMP-dependent transcription factor ATF-3-like [Haliotis rubra]|uniref:cyclic AMP-dependent transcription factor ATF-3-like n=1 Tax=Haliotis rufescens TaxID=6454 RepID=UPI001EAFD803|nr:cyclic AMP-dependent transcription factor ATF-3-like [Haliotis rufescens]XP_046561995.1 cyclic AMP-dependent transcription factor ATF-3-like [Haliotis rubra]